MSTFPAKPKMLDALDNSLHSLRDIYDIADVLFMDCGLSDLSGMCKEYLKRIESLRNQIKEYRRKHNGDGMDVEETASDSSENEGQYFSRRTY